MSKIIRTPYNRVESDQFNNIENGEFYDLETEPSLTDPSQAMEIKDILKMFSRGGQVRVLRAQNFGDEAIPAEFEALTSRINTMDKTDRAQASMDLKDLINTKSESIDKNKKAIAQKQTEAKIRAELKKAQNPKEENE